MTVSELDRHKETVRGKVTLKVFRANRVTDEKKNPHRYEEFVVPKYGLCYSACATVATDTKFPGPQALTQAYRYITDNRDDSSKDRPDLVDTNHGMWCCHFAGSSSHVCPEGVDPALGIALLRGCLLDYAKNEKKVSRLARSALSQTLATEKHDGNIEGSSS